MRYDELRPNAEARRFLIRQCVDWGKTMLQERIDRVFTAPTWTPAANDPGDLQTVALPLVSIILVGHNSLSDLQRCLPTLARQRYDQCEILFVDNASTDGSVDYVMREFPNAKIIHNSINRGYAGANNVGFQQARGEYIAVLNPDTEVHADWLREMVLALQAHPSAGLATPQILIMEQPSRVNTCGNDVTLTGLTFCRGLDQAAGTYSQVERVAAVSGAAFMIRRAVVEEIGGFDEEFFLYFEETDLSLRAGLAGYDCLYVPTAVVLHDYDFRFSADKCYWQERNRYYSLLKTLRWATLLVLLPSLLLSEIIAWGYAGLQGRAHLRSKLNSYSWLFSHRVQISEARSAVQRLRRVNDRVLLRGFNHRLSFTRTVNARVAHVLDVTVNPLLLVLGLLSRAIVRW